MPDAAMSASLLNPADLYVNAVSRLAPMLIQFDRERPLTLIEPLAGAGSLGIFLLRDRQINQLALNDSDRFVFGFLSVVFGLTCQNKRAVNALIASIRALRITRHSMHEAPPADLNALALAYVVRELVNALAQNRPVEDHKEAVIEYIESMYAMRQRVRCIGGTNWRSFCTTTKVERGTAVYYFNAGNLPADEHVSLRAHLLKLDKPWILSCPRSLSGEASFVNVGTPSTITDNETYWAASTPRLALAA